MEHPSAEDLEVLLTVNRTVGNENFDSTGRNPHFPRKAFAPGVLLTVVRLS